MCVPDFPVHQCHCIGRFAGPRCERVLCVNNCNDHGICQEDGTCSCNRGYYGDDCSVLFFEARAVVSALSAAVLLFLLG
jgi:hypothetical protein